MLTEALKTCTKCKEPKPFSEFYKASREENGLRAWCKNCDKEAVKRYRERHPDRLADRQREYSGSNRGYMKHSNCHDYYSMSQDERDNLSDEADTFEDECDCGEGYDDEDERGFDDDDG